MLGNISMVSNIYIICGRTDMRKSIDGLCSIIKHHMDMEPSSQAIYLFCGKRCDRIKVILRESDGIVLLYTPLY